MTTSDTLRYSRLPLNNGSGAMPAVGFGTLTTSIRFNFVAETGVPGFNPRGR